MPNLEKSKEFSKSQMYMAARGDQDAISELYEKTYNQVYRTVKAMAADEDAVLDIVQDSYVKAFQSLDQLDEPENFRAWMKRIATNKAKDYFKKKRPVLFSEMVSKDDEEIDFQDDRTENLPEAVIDRQETTRLIGEMLQTLSEDQRIVIGMFYYEQMSVKEIAQILGCSENTVKSRLNYGRKKVEAQVLDLEKRGTKLYSLAPTAFLMWLFRMDAEAAAPSPAMLQNILGQSQVHLRGGRPRGKSHSASHGAANGAVSAGVKAGTKAGGKVLTTKIVAGVLAASVVGGGAAVAITGVHHDDPQTTLPTSVSVVEILPIETTVLQMELPTELPTEAPLSVMTAEMAYEPIRMAYRKAISVDAETFGKYPEEFINSDHAVIAYYHSFGGFQIYETFYDINHDGINELLFGTGSDGNVDVVDVYGFDGEKAVELIDEPSLGSRSQLQIMTDGIMYLHGSGGASISDFDLFRISSDGASVENVESFTYNTLDAELRPSEKSSRIIAEMNRQLHAFLDKIGEYTPVENFDWHILEPMENFEWQPPEPEVKEPELVDLSALPERFRTILEDYRRFALMDSETFFDDQSIRERYPNLDIAMDYNHIIPDMASSQCWYYAIEDFDGDGNEELFLGEGNPDNIGVRDVFAWNGEAMVMLGKEGNCDFYQDGMIIDHIGNSFYITGVYSLKNSKLEEKPDAEPELLKLTEMDGNLRSEDFENFDKVLAAHGEQYQPQWQLLVQIP